MKKYAKIFEVAILVMALAIPGWLIYGYFHPKKGGKKNQASKGMVPAASATVKVQPSQQGAAPAAPAQSSSTAAGTGQLAFVKPQQQAGPAASATPAPAPVAQANTPAQPQQAADKPQSPAEGGDGESSAVQVYVSRTGRNPFISMDDLAKIKEVEEAKRRKEEEDRLRAAQLAKERNRQIRGPMPDSIHLQGVIGTSAIINNQSIAINETVDGAKLLKVGQDRNGQDYVVVLFRGKRYYFNMDGEIYELGADGRKKRYTSED